MGRTTKENKTGEINMVKAETNSTRLILSVLGLFIGIFLIAASIPSSDKVDLVAHVGVNMPLTSGLPLSSGVTITDVNIEVLPHTIYNLRQIAGITSSGELSISLTIPGDKTQTSSVGAVGRGESKTFTVFLKDVSANVKSVIVELKEDGKLVDSRTVNLQ